MSPVQGKILQRGRLTDPSRLFTIAILLFIVASRWALAPRYLYYFDSANFALAMERFNPALHQPQPPGYPLFVGLTRLIHFWIQSPEQVLVIAGLLGACAATLLIRILAAELFGSAAGVFAMALLASNPVFWFGGITNEIRVFLALCSVGVALLAWRALTRPAPVWLYAAFAALGIAGGFRPFAALLLSPLCIWACLARGRGARTRAIAVAALLACALPWITVTVAAMGGLHRVVEILWGYAVVQFQDTSALFGASQSAAHQMFLNAAVWNFLGAVAWIWALPFVAARFFSRKSRKKAAFLALAFFPVFLFSGFVHIGDPDQALASVAILCAAGAGVLAAKFGLDELAGRWPRVLAIASALIVVHVALFFFPPNSIARAASYRAAAAVDRMTASALDTVKVLEQKGPLTIVHYGSSVASRQLMYYFPDDYLVVLPGVPGQPATGEQPQVFYRHAPMAAPVGEGLVRPGSQRIVCLVPFGAEPPDAGAWHKFGPVFFQSPVSAGPVHIGPYTLALPDATASQR